MRGERNLQDAVLARQRHGLAVLGPHRRIEGGDSILSDGVLRFHARRVPDRSERKDNGEAARGERAQCPPVLKTSPAILVLAGILLSKSTSRLFARRLIGCIGSAMSES